MSWQTIAKLAVSLLISVVVGSWIGVTAARSWVYPVWSGSPDWATVWTMRWTAVLAIIGILSFLTAVAAAAVAVATYSGAKASERLKKTDELIDHFEETLLPRFNRWIASPTNDIASQQRFVVNAFGQQTPGDFEEMSSLINYVSRVAGYATRGDIENGRFFGRLGGIVVLIYCVLYPILREMQNRGLVDLSPSIPFIKAALKVNLAMRQPLSALQGVQISDAGEVTLG